MADNFDLENVFASVGGNDFRAGRQLTAEDADGGTTEISPLKRIRGSHHALARGIAFGGKTDKEVAIENGFSPNTLSRLKSDPSFIELVNYYRAHADHNAIDLNKQLIDVTAQALNVISDRLDEREDDFTVGQLTEIAKMGADRTGFGPTVKNETTVNLSIGAKMQRAQERLAEYEKARVIDVTPVVAASGVKQK